MRDDSLLREDRDHVLIQTVNRHYALGPFLYLAAFFIAFLNAAASMVACMLLALFFGIR